MIDKKRSFWMFVVLLLSCLTDLPARAQATGSIEGVVTLNRPKDREAVVIHLKGNLPIGILGEHLHVVDVVRASITRAFKVGRIVERQGTRDEVDGE